MNNERTPCPVTAYDRADKGYAELVRTWLENPHAYFRSFGPEARDFQRRYRSERLRTMTLVAPAAELAELRPTSICVDGAMEVVDSWEQIFSLAVARLITANPRVFIALQRDGRLDWLGCPSYVEPVAEKLSEGKLCPSFGSRAEVVARLQELFLFCGFRLNEVILQIDPYTDEQWKCRKADLERKRADEKTFMKGRRAAQKAWADAHPTDGKAPTPNRRHFLR